MAQQEQGSTTAISASQIVLTAKLFTHQSKSDLAISPHEKESIT